MTYDIDEANPKLEDLRERIEKFEEDKQQINHDILVLEVGEEIEFNKLETAASNLEPYTSLWGMVNNFHQCNNDWYKKPIFRLNSEAIEKEIK